jgi:hypothetical protein
VTPNDLARSVDLCMNDVLASKLDSHGLRLGYVCKLLLNAYEEKKVTKEVEDNLLVLVEVLEDASKTSKVIGEIELSSICVDLARQVEEMAERYEAPDDGDFALIRKLIKAFEIAKQKSDASKPAAEKAAQGAEGVEKKSTGDSEAQASTP